MPRVEVVYLSPNKAGFVSLWVVIPGLTLGYYMPRLRRWLCTSFGVRRQSEAATALWLKLRDSDQ